MSTCGECRWFHQVDQKGDYAESVVGCFREPRVELRETDFPACRHFEERKNADSE